MENIQFEQKLSWHKPEMKKLVITLDTEEGSLPGFQDMATGG